MLALAQSKSVEGFPRVANNKSFAPKQDEKQAERVVSPLRIVGQGIWQPVQKIELAAAKTQRLAEIDLKKVFGDRYCALKIKSPNAAVGQDSPTQSAARNVVDPAQIVQHLRRRRTGFVPAPLLFAVERAAPALRLDYRQSMLEPLEVFSLSFGESEGRLVGKQKCVGDVRPAFG